MNTQTHKIYFLRRSDGLVKIGTTRKLENRISDLAKEHGALQVLHVINGDRSRERAIHRQFWSFHEYGEWFRGEDALLAAIPTIQDGTRSEYLPSGTKQDWVKGEAELMIDVRRVAHALRNCRMKRCQMNAGDAVDSASEDYGFPRFFLRHIFCGRATTISAFGRQQLNLAYACELRLYRDHLIEEVARLSA